MYLGQMPEPGTPEFGIMAAYRRDLLTGAIPSTMSFEAYKARQTPGSISATAEARRAAIARTPIPETYGPPLPQLPLKYAGEAASAAGAAALKGLEGIAPILLIGGAVFLGYLFWSRR